jgi:hypothetical protein
MQASAGTFGPNTPTFVGAEARANAGTFGLTSSDQPRPDPPPFQRDYRQAAPPFFLDQNELWWNKAVQQNRRNFAATIATGAAGSPPFEGTGQVASHPGGIASTITNRLSEHPGDIGDSARTFVREIKSQVEELRKPASGDGRLPQQNELVNFLEGLAVRLDGLADAIDQALNAKTSSPEPLFIGKAGQIGEQLSLGFMEYIKENRAEIAGWSLRFGLIGAAYLFFKACGLEGEFVAILRDLIKR